MTKCPKVLLPSTITYAGGTGYDPRFQAVWASNGVSINLTALKTCTQICKGTANRVLGLNSVVTGLTVNDSKSLLYQLETVPGQFGIVVYDISNPKFSCFKMRTSCVGRTVTSTGLAAGLAYDESRDLLYISTSERNSTGLLDHYILVSKASSPCTILCRFPLKGTCLSSSLVVTGLAYEDCGKGSILYATDGKHNLEISVVDPLTCSFKPLLCCPASGPYRGLAVLPGWYLKHFGKSCAIKPCPTCPSMHMRTSGGDPSPGNPAFAVELVNAPGGSFTGMFLRPNGCTAGFPFFCSTFHAFPLSFGPFILPIVGTGCNGVAKMPLPIPPNSSLCGIRVCFQSVIVCPQSGVGLSDAIEFVITNS